MKITIKVNRENEIDQIGGRVVRGWHQWICLVYAWRWRATAFFFNMVKE